MNLPDCPTIRTAKHWPCKWAEGLTLGEVYDSMCGPGKVKPCLRCDPLFLPDAASRPAESDAT